MVMYKNVWPHIHVQLRMETGFPMDVGTCQLHIALLNSHLGKHAYNKNE